MSPHIKKSHFFIHFAQFMLGFCKITSIVFSAGIKITGGFSVGYPMYGRGASAEFIPRIHTAR